MRAVPQDNPIYVVRDMFMNWLPEPKAMNTRNTQQLIKKYNSATVLQEDKVECYQITKDTVTKFVGYFIDAGLLPKPGQSVGNP